MDEGSRDLRPPTPVLAFAGVVVFFLYLSWRMDEYEEELRRRARAGLWVLLVLGLLVLAFLAYHALVDGDGRLLVPVSWRGLQLVVGGGDQDGDGGGASPWGVAAAVALLLVLASHKPSFRMFGPRWRYK